MQIGRIHLHKEDIEGVQEFFCFDWLRNLLNKKPKASNTPVSVPKQVYKSKSQVINFSSKFFWVSETKTFRSLKQMISTDSMIGLIDMDINQQQLDPSCIKISIGKYTQLVNFSNIRLGFFSWIFCQRYNQQLLMNIVKSQLTVTIKLSLVGDVDIFLNDWYQTILLVVNQSKLRLVKFHHKLYIQISSINNQYYITMNSKISFQKTMSALGFSQDQPQWIKKQLSYIDMIQFTKIRQIHNRNKSNKENYIRQLINQNILKQPFSQCQQIKKQTQIVQDQNKSDQDSFDYSYFMVLDSEFDLHLRDKLAQDQFRPIYFPQVSRKKYLSKSFSQSTNFCSPKKQQSRKKKFQQQQQQI